MARLFNGTSDLATVTPAVTSFNTMTLSFWLWNDTNGSAERAALGYAPITSTQGFLYEPRYTSAVAAITMSGNAAGRFWINTFTQPSAAAWHHYMITMDRGIPENKVWVDGVAQTLGNGLQSGPIAGNWGNTTWQLMRYSSLNWYWPGRMAELACWGGVKLGTAQAKALAAGSSPLFVWPAGISLYAPLLGGDSPEPDYSGNRTSVTLTGTSFRPHPPVMPGLIRAPRAFQPMPV